MYVHFVNTLAILNLKIQVSQSGKPTNPPKDVNCWVFATNNKVKLVKLGTRYARLGTLSQARPNVGLYSVDVKGNTGGVRRPGFEQDIVSYGGYRGPEGLLYTHELLYRKRARLVNHTHETTMGRKGQFVTGKKATSDGGKVTFDSASRFWKEACVMLGKMESSVRLEC
ncbi:hypothetical protein K470DRAFT_288699 [Piedraia hortae CBS 480.64]|uniref:Uncharacterized protein n=1 Tax=Piedraia hortae CBS 480.64 TaxID=1314780 RepID=A0A6A7BVB8_9PEZI|nr:hypothetical protein K470DRAFT_288699 [Piedraia hortae CBS 480.64]